MRRTAGTSAAAGPHDDDFDEAKYMEQQAREDVLASRRQVLSAIARQGWFWPGEDD